MRLKTYLTEQYTYTTNAKDNRNKSSRLVKKRIVEVYNKIQICDHLTLRKLCMVLSDVYNDSKLRFVTDGEHSVKRFEYVIGSDFFKNGEMQIFLSDKTPEHLQSLTQKQMKNLDSKFFKELVYVISHEMVHVNRIKRMKDMFEFIGYVPIKKHLIDYIHHYAYIASQELLDDNFSPTRSLVHDLIGKLPEYTQFKQLVDSYKSGELSKPSSVGLLDY